ncbi:MAG: aminotransferase class I/II-fold pyridoxal phosphate-dependent enzyme [Phycisphaerales bacterium]
MSTSAPTPATADRLRPFGTTIFAEMSALAVKHRAVNLSQGFPDDPGPAAAHAAANRAMQAGHNQYAPMPGIPTLRQAIADWTHSLNALNPNPNTDITVTAGATEALAAAMLGLVNPGDEVILFEPYYDSYRACVAFAGATPRFVQLKPDPTNTRFTFDEAELRAAFTSKTKLVLVNTPHNPTGTVLSRAELQTIAALCQQHDVLALSDEVYETLTYNESEPHISIASLPGMHERTITVSSIGKSYSLTGWKIGWAVAPQHLTAGIRAAHQFLTFAVATPFQHAAAELLTSHRNEAQAITEHDHAMRDLLVPALTDLGFKCFNPAGTYFVMADHTEVSNRLALTPDPTADVALCQHITEHAKVAAIPPSAFYSTPTDGQSFIRFAFCKQQRTIEQAIANLRQLLG